MKGVVSSAAGRPERGRHRQRRLTRNSGVLVEKIARTKFWRSNTRTALAD
jgi:hypothetical protein